MEPRYPDGDFLCIKELQRVLKDDGKILLTLPYADRYTVSKYGRCYDDTRLGKLTKGFYIEKKEFFIYHKRRWTRVSTRVKSLGHAVACLVLRKSTTMRSEDEDSID
jgi:hypothetical protein